jgi:hypothetical protein
MEDDLFSGLLGELEEQSYSEHPAERVLRLYLQRRLPDESLFSAEVDRLLSAERAGRWTLTEVSLHVATCRECAAKVAELRAGQAAVRRAWHRRWRERLLGWDIKRRLAYYLPLMTVVAGLIVLLLNLFLFNPPSHHPSYIAGGKMI